MEVTELQEEADIPSTESHGWNSADFSSPTHTFQNTLPAGLTSNLFDSLLAHGSDFCQSSASSQSFSPKLHGESSVKSKSADNIESAQLLDPHRFEEQSPSLSAGNRHTFVGTSIGGSSTDRGYYDDSLDLKNLVDMPQDLFGAAACANPHGLMASFEDHDYGREKKSRGEEEFPKMPPLNEYFNQSIANIRALTPSMLMAPERHQSVLNAQGQLIHIPLQVSARPFMLSASNGHLNAVDRRVDQEGSNSAQAIVDAVVASVMAPKDFRVQQSPPSSLDALLSAVTQDLEANVNQFGSTGGVTQAGAFTKSPKKKAPTVRRKRKSKADEGSPSTSASKDIANAIERMYRNKIQELGPLLSARASDDESESSSETQSLSDITEKAKIRVKTRAPKPKGATNRSAKAPSKTVRRRSGSVSMSSNAESPPKRASKQQKADEWADKDYTTRCICDYEHNDDFMIQCEKCEVWQHGDCLGIKRRSVPEHYLCNWCDLRWADREKARRIQKKKREELELSSDESDAETQPTKKPTIAAPVYYPEFYQYLQAEKEEALINKYSPGTLDALRTLNDTEDLSSRELLKQKMCELLDVAPQRPGLVAARTIPVDQPIIEYRGSACLQSEFDGRDDNRRLHPYVLLVKHQSGDTVHNFCIDARSYGNVARAVRRSCAPNSEVKCEVDGRSLRVVLTARELIDKGEEITIPFDFAIDTCHYLVECGCANLPNCPVREHNKQYQVSESEKVNVEPEQPKSASKTKASAEPKGRTRKSSSLSSKGKGGSKQKVLASKKKKLSTNASVNARKGSKWKVRLGVKSSTSSAVKAAANKKKAAIVTTRKTGIGKRKQPTVPSKAAAVKSRKKSTTESENDVTDVKTEPEAPPPIPRESLSRDDRKMRGLMATFAKIKPAPERPGRKPKARTSATAERKEKEKERKEISDEVDFILKQTAAAVKPEKLELASPATSSEKAESSATETDAVSASTPPAGAPKHRRNELKGLQDYWVKKEQAGVAAESWTLPADRTKLDREERKLQELAAMLARSEEKKEKKQVHAPVATTASAVDSTTKKRENQKDTKTPIQVPPAKQTKEKPTLTSVKAKATAVAETSVVKRKPGRPPGTTKKPPKPVVEPTIRRGRGRPPKRPTPEAAKSPPSAPSPAKIRSLPKQQPSQRSPERSSKDSKNVKDQQSIDSDSDSSSADEPITKPVVRSPVGSPLRSHASSGVSASSLQAAFTTNTTLRTPAQKKIVFTDTPSSAVPNGGNTGTSSSSQRILSPQHRSSESEGVPARKRWLRQAMSETSSGMPIASESPEESTIRSSPMSGPVLEEVSRSLGNVIGSRNPVAFVSALEYDYAQNMEEGQLSMSLSQLGYTTSSQQLVQQVASPVALREEESYPQEPVPSSMPETIKKKVSLKEYRQRKKEPVVVPAVSPASEVASSNSRFGFSEAAEISANNTHELQITGMGMLNNRSGIAPSGGPSLVKGSPSTSSMLGKPVKQPVHQACGFGKEMVDGDPRLSVTRMSSRLDANQARNAQNAAPAPATVLQPSMADVKQKIYGFDMGKALGVQQPLPIPTLPMMKQPFTQEIQIQQRDDASSIPSARPGTSNTVDFVLPQPAQEPVRLSLSDRLRQEFGVDAEPEITEVGPEPAQDPYNAPVNFYAPAQHCMPTPNAVPYIQNVTVCCNVPHQTATYTSPAVGMQAAPQAMFGQVFQAFMMGTMVPSMAPVPVGMPASIAPAGVGTNASVAAIPLPQTNPTASAYTAGHTHSSAGQMNDK